MGFVGDLISANQTRQAANTISPEAFAGTQDLAPGVTQAGQQFQQGQDMLLAQAQGRGPNPALEQLKQTTDMNAKQAQGMISSQKGLNPALAARLGAQMGAQANQQAAGQGAVMSAQQQLAAQQMYGQNALQQQNMFQNAIMEQQRLRAAAAGQKAGMLAGAGSQLGKGVGGALQTAGQAGMMAAGAPPTAMSHGGEVPGHAEVSGDSEANDKVPALLSPGEIVIPRTAAKSPDHAKAFIDAIMKHKEADEPEGYAKVLKKHKALEDRIKKLEAKRK